MKAGYELARLLVYVSGLVNQELLLHVEYLAAKNLILRAHAPVRLRLAVDECGEVYRLHAFESDRAKPAQDAVCRQWPNLPSG